MTIWKFDIPVADEQIIEVPEINRPLSVQVQNGTPRLWMLVEPTSERIKVRVLTFGTGHFGITAEMLHVGSYQLHGGDLVFHVFLAGRVRK